MCDSIASCNACALIDGGVTDILEVFHKIWHIIITVFTFVIVVIFGDLIGFRDLLQVCEVVWAELIEDTWKQLLQSLVLSSATDNVGIGSDRSLNLGGAEVDNGSIILEEVHLFDSGNIVHAQAFQSILQTLVIRGTRVCAPLRLPSHTSFTSSSGFLAKTFFKLATGFLLTL